MEEMKMKKILTLLFILVFVSSFLSGCSGSQNSAAPSESAENLTVIKVGASPTPHAEILEAARETLNGMGYDLDIIEYADYVQPNIALDSGDLDANFFQHGPYLENFNAENNMELISLIAVHYEPFGIYAGKTASIEELANGAKIGVPNDGTNEARALKLLEAQGLITLASNAGFTATVNDIAVNPKNLDIIEMEAAQIPRALQDLDLAVINGNYAIDAGLNAETDALAKEAKDSDSAATYANVVAIRAGDEERAELKALAEALTSDAVKQFIEATFEGAVIAMF